MDVIAIPLGRSALCPQTHEETPCFGPPGRWCSGNGAPGSMKRSPHLIVIALVVLLLAVAVWRCGLFQALSWESLARNQAMLSDWVGTHRLLAATAYTLLYVVLVAFSVPESAVVTVAGGLLFGTLIGGVLAVLGSTVGAVILFLIARTALAKTVARRARPVIKRIRPGIKRDGFSYLLALRLVPALPFWLVNLGAAVCGMKLWPYVAATLIGVIPATFVFASIGDGVGSVLAAGGHPNIGIIFSPRILGPLIGLAVLSLTPVAIRHLRSRARD